MSTLYYTTIFLLIYIYTHTHEQAELWQYEMDCARIFEHPESFPARALIVMIDISHMTFSQCTKDLLSILGGFSEFSKVHHPERLRKLYILGAPRLFSFVWNKIIANFIPASTKEKIQILSDYRKAGDPFLNKWMEIMNRNIGDVGGWRR